MSTNNINIDDLNKINQIKATVIIFFSTFDLGIFLFSLLFMYFYLKNIVYIKSKSFLFILINSLNGLIKYLLANNNSLLKVMLIYISYIIQFHLVISSINETLTGQYLFKNDKKDFSIKNILLIDIILLIIVFPYTVFFNGHNIMINIFQNIIIIISIVYLYIYVRKLIYEIFCYLNENNKDIVTIPYIEPKELIRIYIILYNFWIILFAFILFYFIFRFLYIFLINKSILINLIIPLLLLTVEEASVYIIFFCLSYINYLKNKYNTKDTKDEYITDEKSKIKNYSDEDINLKNIQEESSLMKTDNLDVFDDKEEEQLDKRDKTEISESKKSKKENK